MPVMPQRNRFHMPPAITMGALAFLAAMLLVAHPVSAQSETASCADGGAVLHVANNPGLVSDCDTLLAARDTLAGTATLNWLANRPIDLWEGVTVSGSPLRVTELNLSEKGLTGEIPGNLGDLANLQGLILVNNQLTGPIPSELGNLTNLIVMFLQNNQLTGTIPASLGNLSNLGDLWLGENELSGEIPAELASLSYLGMG